MTTPADQVRLPPRPSAKTAKIPRQGAERAARTREAGSGLWAWAAGMLAGASLIDGPQPSIMTVWAAHCHAAAYHQGWWWRAPRYAYGAVHAFAVVPVLYWLAWVTDSIPKALFTAATIWLILWLIPLRLTVTI